uniref:Uncharacterized protein n=1 Tax=Scophthalmus maximus TaxID=52904 RepID=A0A8D3AJE4_SCOMX
MLSLVIEGKSAGIINNTRDDCCIPVAEWNAAIFFFGKHKHIFLFVCLFIWSRHNLRTQHDLTPSLSPKPRECGWRRHTPAERLSTARPPPSPTSHFACLCNPWL